MNAVQESRHESQEKRTGKLWGAEGAAWGQLVTEREGNGKGYVACAGDSCCKKDVMSRR